MTTKLQYEIAHSYWTMDLADPDELVQYALDPTSGGGHSFNTGYNNPALIGPGPPGPEGVRQDQAPGAVHRHPEAGRLGLGLPRVPVLHAVPVLPGRGREELQGLLAHRLNYHLEDVSL